jgi:hypothetical protein
LVAQTIGLEIAPPPPLAHMWALVY